MLSDCPGKKEGGRERKRESTGNIRKDTRLHFKPRPHREEGKEENIEKNQGEIEKKLLEWEREELQQAS